MLLRPMPGNAAPIRCDRNAQASLQALGWISYGGGLGVAASCTLRDPAGTTLQNAVQQAFSERQGAASSDWGVRAPA
jgi:hypothetical protein